MTLPPAHSSDKINQGIVSEVKASIFNGFSIDFSVPLRIRKIHLEKY